MKIDKDQILELLRGQGKHDEADQAGQELPDQVDTDDDEHRGLLGRFGVDPGNLPGGLGTLL
ncbi:hypothetical protein SAMN05443575_0290 [Jatrophihabitans endophyticus]|uniref:Uncharacterized protein n=1 Tax=Jatrophihabitans endophyticus TaxID=1206085 RepID=A0A1M5CMC2_9ACTN|nr:hypothetical protein [Jatrophihabitans endophyticus]SHF55851.1 hypothetical protein SAMN05443575_0290 [Jatrophihabitans endophyticus]